MRNPYERQNNTKIIVYAVVIAIIAGIGFIVMQDISVPTEHVSQEIKVKIEK